MTTVDVVVKNDESEHEEIEKRKNVSAAAGLSVALGPVLGVAVGIATHNIWVWLAIGIVTGIAFSALRSR